MLPATTIKCLLVILYFCILYCAIILTLKGSVKEPNISIYFFPPITRWSSISDVLFTVGREVSDFSVLKYY